MKRFVKCSIHLFQPMQICQIPYVIFQSTNQFSFKVFCINLQCHQTQLLCTFFSSNIIYFGQRSQLKSKCFGFLSIWVKICQVPHVNFQMTSQFHFKFCIILHCHFINSSVNFKLIHFLLWTKESQQSPNFDTFNCSGENLLSFWCHFSNHKSVFLQMLHNSSVLWKITPLYYFISDIL